MAQSANTVGRSRGVWTVLVALFAVFAVTGPVKMIREASDDGDANGNGAATGGDTVVMAKIAYAPTTLTVARGTEVLFRNEDVAPHTVTAEGGGPIDSGVLEPGQDVRGSSSTSRSTTSARSTRQMKAKVVLTG